MQRVEGINESIKHHTPHTRTPIAPITVIAVSISVPVTTITIAITITITAAVSITLAAAARGGEVGLALAVNHWRNRCRNVLKGRGDVGEGRNETVSGDNISTLLVVARAVELPDMRPTTKRLKDRRKM